MEIIDGLLTEQLYMGHKRGPCAYLPSRDSSLLFLHGQNIGSLYRLFLDLGYRRYGWNLYRPDCTGCKECRILRIPVREFMPSRSQRRVWKRGQKLFYCYLTKPGFSQERLKLYRLYLESQHKLQADLASVNERHYREFFVNTFLGKDTLELQLCVDRRLIGLGILDRIGDSISAVYFMFHPEFSRYSPGNYAILASIEQARQWGLAYYYPGYFVKGCSSMNYKANYFPHEIKTIGESSFMRKQKAS